MKLFFYWLVLPAQKEIKVYVKRLLIRLDLALVNRNDQEYCELLLELEQWLLAIPLPKIIKLGMELGGFSLIAEDSPFDKWYFYCVGEGCNTTLVIEFIINGNKHKVCLDRHL